MKILLTGASGFIGGHLLSAIREKYGHESVVVLTSKNDLCANCVEYSNFHDFGLHENYFNEITHIIHAGAFTPKSGVQSNDLKLSFNNVAYTKELLSFNFKSLTKIINISTLDVYAADIERISEKSEIKPISLYASSKLYCEEMVKKFSIEKNINCVNLRVGHVYGPGEDKYKKVLPVAIQNILKDQPLELFGDGSDIRSFIFINDVVKSIVNSIEAQIANIDINVASGTSISIKDLLNKVIKISGKNVEINQIESTHKKRFITFDNKLLLSKILDRETNLDDGLKIEYEYMRSKICK